MLDTLSVLFSAVFLLLCGILSLIILAGLWWRQSSGEGIVQVIVLGDAGRSPRMQYHCLSLVQLNYNVDLIGYGGSSLIKELRESQRITHHVLPDVPSSLNAVPRVLRYFVKVIYQTLTMMWVVFFLTKKPAHTLVQTPPAIPTLFVAVLSSILRGSKLIVDYHNYGHTIMALTLGKKHFMVQLAKRYEQMFAGFAYSNICVSEAMKKDLRRTLGIRAIILYDRPPGRFQRTPIEKRHELFKRLSETIPVFKDNTDTGENVTLFTECDESGEIVLRKKRPFLIISSTSWTEDEDFGILLQALELYEEKALQPDHSDHPNVVCLITGKGPLREYYEKKIAEKKFSKVSIYTLWLSAEDYPVLLGSADLGVSLHKSSSGLDLPMKVVDMFGSGLPVCAINFNCLHELLRHDHNGMIFNDYKELAQQIQVLSQGYPDRNTHLSRYRDNLSSFQSLRWDHYWKLHVLPLITTSPSS